MTAVLLPTVDGRPADVDTLAALALGNYGHFTTMRVEGLAVRGLGRHLERLARDCAAVFGADLDLGRVRAQLYAAMAADESAHAVRVTVFDPAIGAVRPAGEAAPVVLITGRPAPAPGPGGPPLRLATTPYVRDLPMIKHAGLFGPTARRRAAIAAGFDDVVFVGSDGVLTEGATCNIGFHDGARVIWPRRDALPGVTMALLAAAGVPHRTDDVRLADLAGMRAVFVTNSVTGIRPVGAIDGRAVPSDAGLIADLAASYASVRPEPIAPPNFDRD